MIILDDGSAYHMGTKKGEIAQRIITVGDQKRAKAIAKQHLTDVTEIHSVRDMHTYNGTFEGLPISVVAIGMGAPMMDFMLREATYSQPGEIAVVRIGSCGIFSGNHKPGTVLTASGGSVYSFINYGVEAGGFIDSDMAPNADTHLVTKPIYGDDELDATVRKHLISMGVETLSGMNACGETFYACQGRMTDGFDDGPVDKIVIDKFEKAGVVFCEMEGHQLFSLANKRKVKCRAANCCVGIVNRLHPELPKLDAVTMEDRVSKLALAALKALSETSFDSKENTANK